MLRVVAALLVALLLAAGCATRRPVLYPNDHLLAVGSAQAEADVAACLAEGDAYVESGVLPELARHTAAGAVVGGAAGAAGGAVRGRAGTGAAAGAAAGAAGALTGSLLFRRDPDPLVRGYAERCLRQRGYDPIGWR